MLNISTTTLVPNKLIPNQNLSSSTVSLPTTTFPTKARSVKLKPPQTAIRPLSKQTPTSSTSHLLVKSSEDSTDTISEEEKNAMLIKANKILGRQHIPNICKTNQNSSWIMQCIRKAVTGSSKMMKQQKNRFEDGREAAKYSTKILKQCKYDFEKALEKEKGTMLEPGSEFREHQLLEPIFQHHEH